MTHVLGTHVPAAGGAMEICHGFVYRWLQASGRITGNAPAMLTQVTARNILFGVRGQPARAGGMVQVERGSIIGFWDTLSGNLQHSMIAVSPTNWIGANNTGCFGTAGGRNAIHDVDTWLHAGEQHFGWIGAGNQWQGQYQTLEVTYKLPPRRRF